jgi:hypothetical protein
VEWADPESLRDGSLVRLKKTLVGNLKCLRDAAHAILGRNQAAAVESPVVYVYGPRRMHRVQFASAVIVEAWDSVDDRGEELKLKRRIIYIV